MLTILGFVFTLIFNVVFPFLIGFFLGYFPGILICFPIGWAVGKMFKPTSGSISTSPAVSPAPAPRINAIPRVAKPPRRPLVTPTPQNAAGSAGSSIWNTVTAAASRSQNWYTQTQSSSASASNSIRTVYDLAGNPLQLGSKDEKANGGEGIVYTMPLNSGVMIKLYKASTLQDAAKMREIKTRVEAMTKLSACTGLKHLAWPRLPVADDRKQMIGFAMRACGGESFRSIGTIANIKKVFPKWTRLQLAETAVDFVVKVRELAANGVIINDFNPSNFLVDRNCNVSMIDCDSYQIPDKKGNPLITHTFFASHVAPELMKNKHLMDSPRSIRHVEFGAAVVVFGLLMCGLHPYSFYDPSNRKKIGTPEENLLKGYCPFAPGSKLKFPKAPNDEWSNLWSWLPDSIRDAFVATFCDGHSDPNRRASLDQLEAALRDTVQFMKQEKHARELLPKIRRP